MVRVGTSNVNAREVCRASRGVEDSREVPLCLRVFWVALGVQQDRNRMLDGFGGSSGDGFGNVMASSRSSVHDRFSDVKSF